MTAEDSKKKPAGEEKVAVYICHCGGNISDHVDVGTAEDGFIKSVHPKFAPTLTKMEGVFTAGVAIGPKDIVDTIIEAGAAAMEVSNYLTRAAAA